MLHCMAHKRHKDMMALLLDRMEGADVVVMDEDGVMTLHLMNYEHT